VIAIRLITESLIEMASQTILAGGMFLLVMPRNAPSVIGDGPVLSPGARLSDGGLRPNA
jgi:hypothetical protein